VHTSSTVNKKVTIYYNVLLSCISIIVPHRYFYSTILYFRAKACGVQRWNALCYRRPDQQYCYFSKFRSFSIRVKSMTSTMTMNHYNNRIYFRHFSKISRNAYVNDNVIDGFTYYNNMRLYRLPTGRFIHLSLDVIYKL